MDVQRRMPASKISMVTYWSGRTSDVVQGGITMRDSATAGLGHRHDHGHWNRYLYKNFTDLFLKKS